ncbi:ligand-gated ion channel, partial [Tenacibaculum maritimum]
VTIELYINKIYDIETINSTFQVDGYLVLKWKASKADIKNTKFTKGSAIYYANQIEELKKDFFWMPDIEFMNKLDDVIIDNKVLTIGEDGFVVFRRRFNCSFHSKMNLITFPFDTQIFEINFESFLYKKNELVFVDPDLFYDASFSSIDPEWKIKEHYAKIKVMKYKGGFFEGSNNKEDAYSRASFVIKFKRKAGYYLWQVLFPLFLIVFSSWVIFWIKSYTDQLNIGFTLLLTVVAFNFFSNSLLPKLPYNTFLESVIILSYISITSSIILLVYRNIVDNRKLLSYFKLGFPFIFITAIVVLVLVYFM